MPNDSKPTDKADKAIKKPIELDDKDLEPVAAGLKPVAGEPPVCVTG